VCVCVCVYVEYTHLVQKKLAIMVIIVKTVMKLRSHKNVL